VADILFELVRDDVVGVVGGLENGMGATRFSRFVLVGGRASIVDSSVATLEAFLVGEDDVTQNDGGLLLRSQGRWRAWNAGWSGLSALLGGLNCSIFNVKRSVRHRMLERSVCKRQYSILLRIKWCVNIVRGGDVGRHLLGWFDTGVLGGFALRLKMQKG
jgi:hypothetical protein